MAGSDWVYAVWRRQEHPDGVWWEKSPRFALGPHALLLPGVPRCFSKGVLCPTLGDSKVIFLCSLLCVFCDGCCCAIPSTDVGNGLCWKWHYMIQNLQKNVSFNKYCHSCEQWTDRVRRIAVTALVYFLSLTETFVAWQRGEAQSKIRSSESEQVTISYWTHGQNYNCWQCNGGSCSAPHVGCRWDGAHGGEELRAHGSCSTEHPAWSQQLGQGGRLWCVLTAVPEIDPSPTMSSFFIYDES